MKAKTTNSAARNAAYALATFGVLALALTGCREGTDSDPDRIVQRRDGKATVVQRIKGGAIATAPATPPRELAKVVALDMTVQGEDAVTLSNPRLFYGEPPNALGIPAMFTAELLNAAGEPILSIPLWDPRWTFVWNDDENRDAVEIAETAETVVILPFKPQMSAVRIVKNKEPVARAALSKAIASFCEKHGNDPACGERKPRPTLD